MLLDFRKPKCVVLEEVTSYSGKYRCFYGHHWVGSDMCYDVGVVNRKTGEITTRHYHPRSYPNPKAEALACWNTFRSNMTAPPPGEEEQDEFARDIGKHLN